MNCRVLTSRQSTVGSALFYFRQYVKTHPAKQTEDTMEFLSSFITGLSLGSIYALIALGSTMVSGIAKILNFAHGDIIMVGAFTVIVTTSMAMPPAVSVFLAIFVCVVLGIIIERVAYKPLRNASPLSVLITAIGVGYFLQSLALLVFGTGRKPFPNLLNLAPIHITDNLVIQGASVVTLVVTLVLMTAVLLFINRTKTGRAMTAVAADREAAQLMGINVDKMIALTFAIGSALAAVAGLFYGLSYDYIGPYTGAMPGIKAFVAAVFGGIGSVPGAFLGGICLGLTESFAKMLNLSQFADAIVLGVLVVVLVIKPAGLLGKKVTEKV